MAAAVTGSVDLLEVLGIAGPQTVIRLMWPTALAGLSGVPVTTPG